MKWYREPRPVKKGEWYEVRPEDGMVIYKKAKEDNVMEKEGYLALYPVYEEGDLVRLISTEEMTYTAASASEGQAEFYGRHKGETLLIRKMMTAAMYVQAENGDREWVHRAVVEPAEGPTGATVYDPWETTRPVQKKCAAVKSDEAENVLRHRVICLELNRLYKKKNADYGDSFHQSFREEGMATARIRLGDKLNRFKALTSSGDRQVTDESLRDTLIDLANYAIMTVMEMEAEK